MIIISDFHIQSLARKHKQIKKIVLYYKTVFLFCIILISTTNTKAQKGLFLKFSLGSGYATEHSSINSSGFGIAMKNHAIGWGITDKFALHIGEFGGLIKQKIGDYNYINLDAYGLGFSYMTPIDIRLSFLGAYSKVSFAKKWTEATGNNGGNGFGINMSIDKEWFISKRWAIRVGPQLFWIKTKETNYNFFSISLNGSIVFYLKPARQN